MSTERLMSTEAQAELREWFAARGCELRSVEMDGDTMRLRVMLAPLSADIGQLSFLDNARYFGCHCSHCLDRGFCYCPWCVKEHKRAEMAEANL